MRSAILPVVIAIAIAAAPAHAQMESFRPAPAAPQADSAQQARAAYRRGIAAYRRGDVSTARQEMTRAVTSWPTQQAYLEASAALAAVARDTADAARWVDRLAELGVGTGPTADTTFRALAGAPAFDAAVSRLAAATAPTVRSRVRLAVADSTLHPEGIAFDARTARWFVSSVRQRRVVLVDRDGTARDFVGPAADGIAGTFGMAVDPVRRMLWVATTALARMNDFTAADSGRVGVFGYDLDSGRLLRTAWMPRDSSVAHTFGDVAVASNGDVYASDSQAPWIVKLPASGDSLVRFATHPLFRSLQGMAITPDGRTMYVADYSHGVLRVDLATRWVSALGVPRGVTLLGVDGLYWHRGALIAVQNGITPRRVARVCLDSTGRNVTALELLDRNPAVADEPTLGAVVGDSAYYVATSAWEKYDDGGTRLAGTVLRPATVLAVPLDAAHACRR
jgi:hypothetical protein